MEKVHGTSARLTWKDNKLSYFGGGMTHTTFINIFNEQELIKKFIEEFNNIDDLIKALKK